MSKERVDGIGGIFFRARDPKQLVNWYREHLGVPAQETYAEFTWREHENPDQIGKTVWSVFPESTDYFGPNRPAFMINYRVADLDRMVEQLRADGIAVEKSEDESYGKFAWITDPEGNRIELWQPTGE